jgi:hypothetical protein
MVAVAAEAPTQPLKFFIVTLYVVEPTAAFLTVYDANVVLVAALLPTCHVHVIAEVVPAETGAVNRTSSPKHTAAGSDVATTGNGCTVIVAVAAEALLQPLSFFTFTVYVVAPTATFVAE